MASPLLPFTDYSITHSPVPSCRDYSATCSPFPPSSSSLTCLCSPFRLDATVSLVSGCKSTPKGADDSAHNPASIPTRSPLSICSEAKDAQKDFRSLHPFATVTLHAWGSTTGISQVVVQSNESGCCGLCGNAGGWMTCGRCMGEGGFATRPGLAGVKAKVGWARCKTCFGHAVVPCLLCGLPDTQHWKQWLEHARRHPLRKET